LFIVLTHAIEYSLANEMLQPDGNADWKRRYAAAHKQHLPSPQQLAEGYRKQQKKAEKAEHAHEEFLKSPAHLLQSLRRAHQQFQEVQAENKLNRSDALPDETLSAQGLRCGSHVPLKDLGIMDTAFTRALFWSGHTALLQGGPSMSEPGSGVTQTLADNGRSVTGVVTGVGSKTKQGGEVYKVYEEVDPFVKVFKDGYSAVGCFKDQMHEFGDLYGDNKDQYREHNLNVSIVKYKEIVLREKQVAMSPKICYEFCRTVPNMVFFGITDGRDCYCMPFYHKGASGSDNCDMSCPGDPTIMCGGAEKSSIFEMHMCADTAGDLLYNAVKVEVELVYFYDTAFMTDKLAHWLEDAAKILKKVAGSVGDMGATALAQEALLEAASLFDPNTGWGVCRPQYAMLLGLYDEAKPLYDADFSFAKNLQKAEDTMFMFENLRKKLHQCATDAEVPILAVYPFYYGFMASLDEKELQEKTDGYIDGSVGFYPAIYMMNQIAPEEMSSCKGELLGRPKPIPFSSCAEACDQITQPVRCAGFQYFQFMDGDTQYPLCYLFSEMEEVRTYRCKELRGGLVLDQEQKQEQAKKFRGAMAAIAAKKAVSGKSPGTLDVCTKVRIARQYSYLSCESIFGKNSKVVDKCPDVCADKNGAMNTAVCMGRLSLGNPRIKHKQVRRCFGENQGKTSQANADWRLQEFGIDASGGAGPKIEGEIKMAGTVVEEPYGHVWTPGPAGQR